MAASPAVLRLDDGTSPLADGRRHAVPLPGHRARVDGGCGRSRCGDARWSRRHIALRRPPAADLLDGLVSLGAGVRGALAAARPRASSPGARGGVSLQFLAGYLQGSLYITGRSASTTRTALCGPNGVRASGRLLPFASSRWPAFSRSASVHSSCGRRPTSLPRRERTAGLPYIAAAEDGWTTGDLATLLFPFRGVEEDPPHRALGDRIYAGWMLTLLLPFAFGTERRRMAVFCAMLAAGAIAVALPDTLPFFRWHHAIFPGLRVPGRILFLRRPLSRCSVPSGWSSSSALRERAPGDRSRRALRSASPWSPPRLLHCRLVRTLLRHICGRGCPSWRRRARRRFSGWPPRTRREWQLSRRLLSWLLTSPCFRRARWRRSRSSPPASCGGGWAKAVQAGPSPSVKVASMPATCS